MAYVTVRIDTAAGPRWVGGDLGSPLGSTPNPNLAACFESEADARRTPGVAAYLSGLMGKTTIGPLDIKKEHAAWVARGRPWQ